MGTSTRTWNRPALGITVVGLMGAAFGLGRYAATPQAHAAPPKAGTATAPAPVEPSSDYSRRWVAVINGNIPVTREEFGEYLIARQSEKLELLVNKRIIENACRRKGVEVTQAEVEGALAEDLKGMKITLQDFIDKILKAYHKSLYEWKEDVIRPKLALAKLCRDRVSVTEQDYKDAFEAYYGEKVDCRLILFPKEEHNKAMQMYDNLRKDEVEFNRMAKQQASGTLAATGGQIQPIGHHTTGNGELEREAFSLRPGEVSRLLETPEGFVILKCVKRIPADTTKKLEIEKAKLEKEIIEKKTQVEMPKLFKELQDAAQPKLFLKKYATEEDLVRDVKRDLQGDIIPAGNISKPPMK
jgi:hypothetical protein